MFQTPFFTHLCSFVNQYANSLLKIENLENQKKSNFKSGFTNLDLLTNHFQPSKLVIIGGVHETGTSSFLLSLITNMAIKNKYESAIFSSNSNEEKILQRLTSIVTEIPFEKIINNILCEENKKQISEKIKYENFETLYFSDFPFRSIAEIEDVLNYYPENLIQIMFIDSIENIGWKRNDKAGKILNKRELTEIAARLKLIAEKFNILIIVGFTLSSKHNEKLDNYRPSFQQLQKTAPIGNFADLVLLLYRPEYYKIFEWEDENPTIDEAEICIVKNNFGLCENVRILFNGNCGKFDNLKNK